VLKLALFLLAALTLPAYADGFASCTATVTDSVGNVQPWNCPHWSAFISESSITASGLVCVPILLTMCSVTSKHQRDW